VSFNAFDEKIRSMTRRQPCHQCELGRRKLYIDWDGAVYPCIQFGGLPDYRIGEVTGGIDEAARNAIYRRSLVKPAFCRGCALEQRCVNDCACLNFQQSGDMAEVSPVQCAWQRMLIAAADDLARRMLAADETAFVQRYC
jgi:radical SAM protein with 4Fe4S-binding SPASM domain